MTPASDRTAYSYELPRNLIAQEPPPEREAARLLLLQRTTREIAHRRIRELAQLLEPGDLLVLNDTKVLAARVELRRESGGRISGILLEVPRDDEFTMMLEGRGRLAEGDRLRFGDEGVLWLRQALGQGHWRVACNLGPELLASGRMPLPPYIKRSRGRDARDAADRERYQTVFAEHPGAVAAPTAGLHFSPRLLGELEERQVETARITLHVGPGTFQPVREQDLSRHLMHAESFRVPAATVEAIERTRGRGGRVIAVGTTVVRTLEAAAAGGELRAGSGETTLFIRPPFRFRIVDGLLTNFHLPESTLLILVCAFAGRQAVLNAYAQAVAERYRFFSYGDAMLIL